ncbi:hypothetical protein [Parafrankia sp. FMc2]|uniref:hypothetical protein n=1 Tax=Parafrankia sp. FMc2 TaxID=3233196 RepID=UPI0034D44CB1
MSPTVPTQTTDPLPRWTPPAPTDLPNWRARLCDSAYAPVRIAGLMSALGQGRGSLVPLGPRETPWSLPRIAAELDAAETRRLAAATLFHVTADMTALALSAATTPPTEQARGDRLPAPGGFMLFEEPIGSYTIDLRDTMAASGLHPAAAALRTSVPIVAVSWSLWDTHDEARWTISTEDGRRELLSPQVRGVWITFYTATGSGLAALPQDIVVAVDADGVPLTADQITPRRLLGPLTWDDEMIIPFGASFPAAAAHSPAHWAQVVYTAWQLIIQRSARRPLTAVDLMPRDRAGRRRDARARITTGDVRVVRVHPAHRPTDEAALHDRAGSTGRDVPLWTHRWPVAPYRRSTCLNPRLHADGGCEHAEQIVAAHLKGPAHLPLRTRPTVHLWDAPPPNAC